MTSVGDDIDVISTSHSLIRYAEQEMFTLPENLILPLVFIEVHVVLVFVSP